MNLINNDYSNSELTWRILLTLCVMVAIISAADSSFATAQTADSDPIGYVLCNIVQNLTGGIAKSIATVAIFAVGVGLFMGKLNWGTAFATAAGVGIIFAAPKLVQWIGGSMISSQNCMIVEPSTTSQ